jgi:3-hydroxyacyl-CoA dehydrogenase
MVRGKRLGVKTGIGFYDYSAGPRNKVATDK